MKNFYHSPLIMLPETKVIYEINATRVINDDDKYVLKMKDEIVAVFNKKDVSRIVKNRKSNEGIFYVTVNE